MQNLSKMSQKEVQKFLQETYEKLIKEHHEREGIKNPATDVFFKYKGDWDKYNENFFKNFEVFYEKKLKEKLKEIDDDFILKKECQYRWSIVSYKQKIYFDIVVIEPIYHKWFAENEEIYAPLLHQYKLKSYEKYFGCWCPEHKKEF